MSKKLVLIDGNSIIYRAFFALPLLNNDKGIYTNGVFGFMSMLLRILEEEEPTHMLVAFDAGKTTFRHATYKEYKGGRQKTPPELSEQFPVLKEVLNAFGIQHYQLEQYEADDIIGTLATNGDANKWDVTVFSGDKDLLQLVNNRVRVHLTKKGISDVEEYTPSFMEEKMGITPDQIIDLKALMGDNSDNIPGVPGIGQKTAIKLLDQYTTLENVYEHIDELSGKKLKENLHTYKDDAFMSKGLVTIERESPITIKTEDLVYDGFDKEKVFQKFQDLGFASLIDRLGGDSTQADEQQTEMKEIDYKVVDRVTNDMFSQEAALVIEMLQDNYHYAPVEGIGVVTDKANYFIPADVAFHSNVFKDWAENPQFKKGVFDAKQTYVALIRHNVQIKGLVFDMLLASYLLNPAENNHDIPRIAGRYEKNDVSLDESIYGKGAKMQVPEPDVLSEHVVRKTHALYSLKNAMESRLKENEQYELAIDLELPLSIVLGRMEHTGVRADKERLSEMGTDLKARLSDLEQEIQSLAGETFNLNSPKQLGPILFEKLELPVIKKTKTGYSTAADVLEKLADKHEIIPKLLLYRQLDKLQSTYIEGLMKVIDANTGKIHTRFNQALTQTGRLSSIEPNLQNIPIRLEEGRKIRQAFVPDKDGWMMFSADYSQIELRVLAHIAGDEKLIDAFKENVDIHTQTAQDVFHVEKDEITDLMRRQAKAVNFGIVYGISDYGLSQNLGISRKEAKQFIEQYFTSYPGVKTYMENIVQTAKHQGYVTTLMKRRRYLPEITSRNFNVRSFAERTAMNTPIQGSAADIIKKAMLDLDAALQKENVQARMLLQVHDELILEAPEDELDILKDLVLRVMENTVDLIVPLKTDFEYGKSWYDAK